MLQTHVCCPNILSTKVASAFLCTCLDICKTAPRHIESLDVYRNLAESLFLAPPVPTILILS